MKVLLGTVFLTLLLCNNLIGQAQKSENIQSGEISCISYKQIFKTDGKWDSWPGQWTSYKSEGRSNPIIRVTNTDDTNTYFRIQMFIDGEDVADFTVTYDADISEQKRADWDDEEVYCYRDEVGDYIYTQNCYLSQLAKNPNAWAENKEAKLYMWIFSDDMAVLVK